jgi:hypothetical protein
MIQNKFLIGILGLLLGASLCVADDVSARRYAEFADNDEMTRISSLIANKDVQDELRVTHEQIAKIKQIYNAPKEDIPGLVELIAKNKTQQSDSALSPLVKDKVRESFNADFGRCIETYQRKELRALLSADQWHHLDELEAQMRGPIAILDTPAISSKLQLTEKQKAEMEDMVKHYDAGLGWLRGRYGRQQISGFHKNETEDDREKELQALFVVIRAIEKERDAALFAELTPDQRSMWSTIQGKLVRIDWPPTTAFESSWDE